jgi:hypothetical protein
MSYGAVSQRAADTARFLRKYIIPYRMYRFLDELYTFDENI